MVHLPPPAALNIVAVLKIPMPPTRQQCYRL